MAQPFCLTSPAKALALLFALVPCANASTDTVADWTFSQNEGPIVNTPASGNQNERTAAQRNNGWIGYSPNNDDDDEVDRRESSATFNGQRNSIILIDDANHTDFNPGYKSLIINARFVINPSVLLEEALGLNQTWNLVQKGRFNNPGGQWKMQIRKDHSGRIFLQCLVNDDKPDTRKTAAQLKLNKAWLADEHTLEGRCILDREQNELTAELVNTAKDISMPRVTKALTNNFGAVAPQTGLCGTPNSFGGNVAIGNKPLCPDQKLDTNDAFRGTVYNVQIQRY